jgi:uncharacterized membrane protein (UPF0127 family)
MSNTTFGNNANKLARMKAVLLLGALFVLALYGCSAGTSSAPTNSAISANSTSLEAQATVTSPAASPSPAAMTATPWVPPTALVGTPLPGALATLTAAPQLQTGLLTITNKKGKKVNMTVEIADTDASRTLGLMHRSQMDPDAGMLFSWTEDIEGGFWMHNTILPLSIAFIAADGTILSIHDMQPLDERTTSPGGPYRYALETNQGFFRVHNITAGDKVTLPGQQQAVVPGMPSCCCPEGAPTVEINTP